MAWARLLLVGRSRRIGALPTGLVTVLTGSVTGSLTEALVRGAGPPGRTGLV